MIAHHCEDLRIEFAESMPSEDIGDTMMFLGSQHDDATWFCFSSVGDYRAPLPFAWEELAVISVDRNWHAKAENVVVVGRRLASHD